jgi:hypothetical protein
MKAHALDLMMMITCTISEIIVANIYTCFYMQLKITKNNENMSSNVVVCLSSRCLLSLRSNIHSLTLTRAVYVTY